MTNRWSRFVLLLVVVALTAAACGDDSSETTTTTTATPTTEDAASTTGAGEGALETTTMTAGALPLVDFAPLFYAEAMGYFEEEGLNVTIDQGEGSAATVTRIMGGAYDAGFGDINAIIQNAAARPGEWGVHMAKLEIKELSDPYTPQGFLVSAKAWRWFKLDTLDELREQRMNGALRVRLARVLADQMQYLLAHIPRSSPLHARLSGHLENGEEIVEVHYHD